MKVIICLVSSFFVLLNICTSQSLVSYEKIGTKSLEQMMADYSFLIQTGVDHYRVLYTTVDVTGVPDTASGLITVPLLNDNIYPVCIHQHGTVSGREDVPSNLRGGFEIGEVASGFNMIAISPDYLGLGTSRGQHPYIHADSEAWVALDMYSALDEFLDAVDYARNDQIFVTGYSQGGHASMAVHRSIETSSNSLSVTAASHMSGPYSVSDRMIEFTLSDQEYFFSAYLANVTLSMKTAYPELLADYELEDIFKSEYLASIDRFVNEEIGLFELNSLLEEILMDDVGALIPRNMLHDSILTALFEIPEHPLSQSLALQDVYDWTPMSPTRIFYCEADEQVWFENGVLAGEVMNANGAPDVMAASQGEDLDHNGCAPPAVTSTMLFFLQFADVISNTNEINAENNYRLLSQLNFDQISIAKNHLRPIGDHFRILNAQGLPVDKGSHISSDLSHYSIGHLVPGFYFLIIEETGEVLKFMKY